MTLKKARELKPGDTVFNKHCRRNEVVVAVVERPANDASRTKYPLIRTDKEPSGISYLLCK